MANHTNPLKATCSECGATCSARLELQWQSCGYYCANTASSTATTASTSTGTTRQPVLLATASSTGHRQLVPAWSAALAVLGNGIGYHCDSRQCASAISSIRDTFSHSIRYDHSSQPTPLKHNAHLQPIHGDQEKPVLRW